MEIDQRERVQILVPDNWHCHLRNGRMLEWMVQMSIESGFRGRLLWMPNTKPEAIFTGQAGSRYESDEIQPALELHAKDKRFVPVGTIQITEQTKAGTIQRAKGYGIRVAKIYPRYVTTNSESGVVDYWNIVQTLHEAAESGMICCFHCEDPSYDIEGLSKEAAFISTLDMITRAVPHLRIVVEHVTTQKMLHWVRSQKAGSVRATITAHHLALTLDDVIGYSKRSGGLMRPHNGCKPQPKSREDREALQVAAMSGDAHFFLGLDDAPHLKKAKECDGCACGIFSTTVALPFLIQLFKDRGALPKLDSFIARFGAEFYGYPVTHQTLTFENRPWIVRAEYPVPGMRDSVVPLFAGEEMQWKLVD